MSYINEVVVSHAFWDSMNDILIGIGYIPTDEDSCSYLYKQLFLKINKNFSISKCKMDNYVKI